MELHEIDDEIGIYFRRRHLARRFLMQSARSKIVCRWSGMTSDQLKALRPRWGFAPKDRNSGPARTAFKKFMEPAKRAEEFALLGGILRIVGLKSYRNDEGESVLVASLENGERALEAFEIFREWEPRSAITFEESLRLAEGLISGKEIELERCPPCTAAMLHLKVGEREERCLRCRRLAGSVRKSRRRKKAG